MTCVLWLLNLGPIYHVYWTLLECLYSLYLVSAKFNYCKFDLVNFTTITLIINLIKLQFTVIFYPQKMCHWKFLGNFYSLVYIFCVDDYVHWIHLLIGCIIKNQTTIVIFWEFDCASVNVIVNACALCLKMLLDNIEWYYVLQFHNILILATYYTPQLLWFIQINIILNKLLQL